MSETRKLTMREVGRCAEARLRRIRDTQRLNSESAGRPRMYIQINSYTDHSGAAMPQGLHLHGTYVAVVETLDQWHGADHRYVKVTGDDGGLYILRFDESRAVWDLTMFESKRARALRAEPHDCGG